MTRDKKIDEILTLINLPPREFAVARVNYEKLTDLELDARLERLRAGSAVIEEWRKQHRVSQPAIDLPQRGASGGAAPIVLPTDAAPKQTASALPEGHYVAAGGQAAKRLQISGWIRRVRDWREQLAEELIDLVRLIRGLGPSSQEMFGDPRLLPRLAEVWNLARIGGELGSSALLSAAKLSQIQSANAIAKELLRLASSNELFASYVDHRLRALVAAVDHPPLASFEKPRLTPGEFIDAFARVVNVVNAYPPDVIVTLNQASWVGRLLKHHLSLSSPIIPVHGSADTKLQWHLRGRWPERPLVCIVGDTAWTGKTLSEAIAGARDQFQTDRVFGVVLAVSKPAAERFGDARDVRYHLRGDTISRIAFTRRTSLGEPPSTPVIEVTRRIMRQRYPVDPMPWEIKAEP